MRRIGLLLAGGLLWLLVGPAIAQPLPGFVLQQNVPNPFCPAPGGDPATMIQFATPQVAEVHLTVWTPDGGTLVRTLVNGNLSAGYHAVAWDGRDELGVLVSDGTYPYRMLARDPGGSAILFEATLWATVGCAVPARNTTWGFLRALFVTRWH
jgi:hypothetical protein